MKRTIFFAFALLCAIAQGAWAQTNWMEQLDDSRLVTDLSLPGTHDAANAQGWTGLAGISFGRYTFGDMAAKAQDLTITEQWNIGVRAFDIRPQ